MTKFDLVGAIAACKPRGTVVVKGAVKLAKKLVITKPITIIGGTISGASRSIVVEIRADVTLKNITIARTGGIGDVVFVKRGKLAATNLVVRGGKPNKLDSDGAGLRFDGPGVKGTLVACVFEKNHDGLLVESNARVDAEKCIGRGNANTCIAYQGRSSGSVAGCKTDGSQAGVFLGERTTAVVKGGTFENAKIANVMFRNQTTARVEGCVIKNGKEQGMLAWDTAAPTVVDCRIEGSRYQGIWWTGAARGTIEGCEISQCKVNGMNADDKTSPVIRDVRFHHNKSQGLLIGGKSTARVEDCTAQHNGVSGYNVWESARPTFIRCTARANKDSGFFIIGESKVRIEKSTASENGCDGVFVSEEADAILDGVIAEGNTDSGISTYEIANATIRNCVVTKNKDDGIALNNDASDRLELVGNRGSNNGDNDLYICDDVVDFVLEKNQFAQIRGLYFVTRETKKMPPLLAKFADFVATMRSKSLGYFELCIEPLDPSGYSEHAAILGKALAFLTLPEGSILALLEMPEPRPVVLIGSEGELSTVANSLPEFLHRLAARKTKLHELDEKTAKGRPALRAWLKANKVKLPATTKLFDFTAYLKKGAKAPPSDAARATALAKVLPKIEKLVANDRELVKSLGKPASPKAMTALAAAFGGAVPSDVATWFAWHDGQKSFTGLHPEENWTMITAKDAVEIWDMLNTPGADLLPPQRDTLVPLFDNGGGDHLMYETTGASRGSLFTYYHDDKNPPKRASYASLASWVENAIRGRIEWSSAKRVASDLDFDVKFKKVAPPKLDAFLAAPIGATYYRSEYISLYDGPAIHLYVKITDVAWAEGWGRTVSDATDEVQQKVEKEPEKKWSSTAKSAHGDLTYDTSELDAFSKKKVPPGLFYGVANTE